MENFCDSNKGMLRIVSYSFLPDPRNPILTIEEIGCSTFIRLSLVELSKDIQMIKEFSSTDAYKIGYLTGML